MNDPQSNDEMDDEVFRMVNPDYVPPKNLPETFREARRRSREADELDDRKAELAQYILIGAILIAAGGLHIVGTWMQDVGLTAGGVFIATGLCFIGVGLARWRWR